MGVKEVKLEKVQAEVKNYGSTSKPKYTIFLEVKASLEAEPDLLHSLCVEERLISSRTVPTSMVVNFRGDMEGRRPYYKALLMDKSGSTFEYVVEPKYKGGFSNVTYEPLIQPPNLRHVHPIHFKSMGWKVLGYELNNYRFTSGLKRYECFNLEVYGGGEEPSTVLAMFKEAGLEVLGLPCRELLELLDKILAKLGGLELKRRAYEEVTARVHEK
ncbi:MAG: hypothetical protein DRJ98_04180 [Thermoprotei archaeon]|nr:MAG: hypothetical protein DRJ98_04180 [Thermoprotei archaeon]